MEHSTDQDGLVKISLEDHHHTHDHHTHDHISNSGGGWHLYVDYLQDVAWKKDVFTASETEAIIRIGESLTLRKGTVGPNQISQIRNSEVAFLFPSPDTSWIFDRLCVASFHLNNDHFQFELDSFSEGLQFTKYSAPSEHYDWHIDRSFGRVPRKLSMSVQLSRPDAYAGGDLELRSGSGVITAPKDLGTVIAFPSFVQHRVSPITFGVRYSLVAWITGRPFK